MKLCRTVIMRLAVPLKSNVAYAHASTSHNLGFVTILFAQKR